jgi:hypothetical protein
MNELLKQVTLPGMMFSQTSGGLVLNIKLRQSLSEDELSAAKSCAFKLMGTSVHNKQGKLEVVTNVFSEVSIIEEIGEIAVTINPDVVNEFAPLFNALDIPRA